MQRLGHFVLLLVIVLLPNKSKGNTSESLNHPNNNDRYDTTTHFTNSPRNETVHTLREVLRENYGNNPYKETSSTSAGREDIDEEEDDEFVRRKITIKREDLACAYKTAIEIFVTPIRDKNGVYFMTEPRDNNTKSKKNYIHFCCPFDHRLSIKEWKCLVDQNVTFPFAHKMDCETYVLSNAIVHQSVPPCEYNYLLAAPDTSPGKVYIFDDDATVHFPGNYLLSSSDYCLAAVNQAGFDLILCGKSSATIWIYVLVAIIVSLIFLLITFVVYSVLGEFQNMHGYTLRAYIASLFVSNATFVVYLQMDTITYSSCALLGFVFNFAMYSTFLWLNVTCFDIWWTFRKVLPINETRESCKERKSRLRKTFVIYALYAWGSSFVVTFLTIIMDFALDIPDYLIKPQICKNTFWFGSEKAKILYFYVPIGSTLICNICLFVLTALKILCDKKRINRQMKNSESRRHDDCNKERLWVYLKLFIMMGINWIPINHTLLLEAWMVDEKSYYVCFVADLITPLQGIIIFIIFVCKRKITTSIYHNEHNGNEGST